MPESRRDEGPDILAIPRVGGARLKGPTSRGDGPPDLEAWYEADAVRAGVRDALLRMRGRSAGPLDGIVRPGDRVVLKPNLIRHKAVSQDEWRHVITHPAVVAAVLDLVLDALDGRGSVVITDGPQTDSSFDEICRRTGLKAIVADAAQKQCVPVELIDLRQEEWRTIDGVVTDHRQLAGDPMGYTDVDLAEESAFAGGGRRRYYGASYDIDETNRAHGRQSNRYRLSSTVLDADVLINIPKLKTHKKAGITASLKNLVGVNGNKNWLPHYTLGFPSEGGDQYPAARAAHRAERAFISAGKTLLRRFPALARPLLPLKKAGRAAFGDTGQVIRSGNWYGNDTIWRMILDLNRAVLWYDASGQRRNRPRRYVSLVDAVVLGQGRGPEDPDPLPAGWLLAGTNPVAVDAVGATLMGLDWRRIPSISNAFANQDMPLCFFSPEAVLLCDGAREHALSEIPEEHVLRVTPHFGWAGHIERPRARVAS